MWAACPDILQQLRTADIYTGLKKGVTNALAEDSGTVGDRMIDQIRKTKSSIKQLVVPGMFFEDMGITYLGPIPGHDIRMLCKAFQEAKKVEGPVPSRSCTDQERKRLCAGRGESGSRFHGIRTL